MQDVSRTRGWPAKTKKKEKLLFTLLSPFTRSQPRRCLNTSTVWASVDVPNSVSISDNATAAAIVAVLLLLTYFLPSSLSLCLSHYLPHSYLFEPACSAVGFLLNPRLLCWLTLALVHNTSRQCNMAKARLLGNNIKCRTTSWTLHHPSSSDLCPIYGSRQSGAGVEICRADQINNKSIEIVVEHKNVEGKTKQRS